MIVFTTNPVRSFCLNRRLCGLPPIETFADLAGYMTNTTVANYAQLYRSVSLSFIQKLHKHFSLNVVLLSSLRWFPYRPFYLLFGSLFQLRGRHRPVERWRVRASAVGLPSGPHLLVHHWPADAAASAGRPLLVRAARPAVLVHAT